MKIKSDKRTGAGKISKSIIRLIKSTKNHSKKKKSRGKTENNSANKDTEILHATAHIFIHGRWF